MFVDNTPMDDTQPGWMVYIQKPTNQSFSMVIPSLSSDTRFPTAKSRECHVSVVWKAVLLWITSVTDSIILQDTCCTRTYSFQMCAVSPKEKDICHMRAWLG